MRKIEWDESLSIGVPLIDEQHKTWIKCLADVSAAVELVQGPQRIAEALGFLLDYTRTHFATEEKAMEDNQYAGLADHRAKHEQLKKTLADLEEEYKEEGATHILAESVGNFMANWLVTHIKEVDLTFGAFLREKGVVLAL